MADDQHPPENPNQHRQTDRLQVSDPEEYNNQRRLRQLHNAREDFVRIRRDARGRLNPNDERDTEISEYRYYEIVSNALLDYLIEVEPVMRTAHHQTRHDNADLDYTVHPDWEDESVVKAPDGSELTLADIVEEGGQMPTEDGDDLQPLDDLRARKAYRYANRLLTDVGLGVALDKGGLPMIQGFDQSRDDAEPTVTNARMNGDPPL